MTTTTADTSISTPSIPSDTFVPIVTQRDDLPPITHPLLLQAARGEYTPTVPCWAMRQAGRYLPEFRMLRTKADFFTVSMSSLCVVKEMEVFR